jgi:hypothetical protein
VIASITPKLRRTIDSSVTWTRWTFASSTSPCRCSATSSIGSSYFRVRGNCGRETYTVMLALLE